MTHTYQKTAHRSSLEILQEEAGAKNWWLSLPLAFLAIAAEHDGRQSLTDRHRFFIRLFR